MSTEFLITALVVCLLPGSGVLYTLAVGLGRGIKASIAASFGSTLGIIPSALASIVGLAPSSTPAPWPSRPSNISALPICFIWPGRF